MADLVELGAGAGLVAGEVAFWNQARNNPEFASQLYEAGISDGSILGFSRSAESAAVGDAMVSEATQASAAADAAEAARLASEENLAAAGGLEGAPEGLMENAAQTSAAELEGMAEPLAALEEAGVTTTGAETVGELSTLAEAEATQATTALEAANAAGLAGPMSAVPLIGGAMAIGGLVMIARGATKENR